VATSTGPDLTAAREAVRALMDDECRLLRDMSSDGPMEAVLDTHTLSLVQPAGAGEFLVYQGRCKVQPAGTAFTTAVEREARKAQREVTYNIGIPFDAPQPREGDSVVVVSARSNDALIGRRFRVGKVLLSTFHLQWKMIAELREGE